MKIKLTRHLMLFTAVILLSGGLVAYAATTLFSQSFPGQTFATATLTAGSCGGSLVLDPSLSTYTVAGSIATLLYACDTSESPAFSSTGSTSDLISVTPTFTVPSGWILDVDNVGDNCHAPIASLTTATPVTLPGGTNYIYCLSSSSASNFTSFSITWSQ